MSQIKPLRWSKTPPDSHRIHADEDDVGSVWSLSVGGAFQITKTAMLWMADDPFVWKQFDTIADAKAAAQAKHEKMIRAFLVPEPVVLATGDKP